MKRYEKPLQTGGVKLYKIQILKRVVIIIKLSKLITDYLIMTKKATDFKLCNTSTINTGIKISKSKSVEQSHECNF